MKTSQLKIYDTTLRDGTQGEGIAFSVTDKLLITERLDQFGVDYIEGGFPAPIRGTSRSSPKWGN